MRLRKRDHQDRHQLVPVPHRGPAVEPPPAASTAVTAFLGHRAQLEQVQSPEQLELLTVTRGLMLASEWRYSPSFVKRYENRGRAHPWHWSDHIDEVVRDVMQAEAATRTLFVEEITLLAMMANVLVPATQADYGTWLKGYLAGGGKTGHARDAWPGHTKWFRATDDLRIVPLYGAAAVRIIVPAGVTYRGGERGHSEVYLTAGFRWLGFGWPDEYNNVGPRRPASRQTARPDISDTAPRRRLLS
jgi:hypothetical protein